MVSGSVTAITPATVLYGSQAGNARRAAEALHARLEAAGLRARLLRAANAQLTVTECDGGLRSGSVINFTIVDDRVRFDVSLDAAEKNNVKLSSRLLTVANRVQKGAS